MISRCSRVITKWLEMQGAINHEDYDLYYYASYSLIITVLPVVLALIVGVVMGTPINSLLVILPFVVIRKYSGGYHAKNAGVCMFFSVAIICVFTWISSHVVWNERFAVIVWVSALSLCVLSPIESINKDLSYIEKKRYKRITVCLAGGFLVLIQGLYNLDLCKPAIGISTGLILSASLQVPCILGKIWKNIKTKRRVLFYLNDVD